ncbi:MAG: TIGR01777 family protein [Planctomycetaceae bacterium]|nr:TIGR01777 family protein [Planctomycetaceae bacterium]
MRIAISGATGLVGSAFAQTIQAETADVLRLVRRNPEGTDIQWDPSSSVPAKGEFDALNGCEAVVHLAGENIAEGRWTAAKKQRIRDSRVHSTRRLAEGLAQLNEKPSTLVCASAIGIYGNAGDQMMTEGSPAGTDFLAEVCSAWEKAADPARTAGIRVVHLRIGVVLSDQGGALAKMLTPFRLGFGGRVGTGQQYMSWIALPDLVGVIRHAISHDSISGPINSVAPAPVTNAEFTKTLGKILGRPTLFPMPAIVARTLFGEMGDALLLSSTRVSSEKLVASGYDFKFPELTSALRGVIR